MVSYGGKVEFTQPFTHNTALQSKRIEHFAHIRSQHSPSIPGQTDTTLTWSLQGTVPSLIGYVLDLISPLMIMPGYARADVDVQPHVK